MNEEMNNQVKDKGAVNTYTYTARNAAKPEKVITFTLYDDELRVNMTGVLESLKKISGSEEKRTEAKAQIKEQAQPAVIKMIEGISGPIHVGDVHAKLNGSDGSVLNVTAWKRAGGLRLAPIKIKVKPVDNPEAAEGFVDELEERKTTYEHGGRFFGPLDYWFGWAALVVILGVLLRWPARRNQ